MGREGADAGCLSLSRVPFGLNAGCESCPPGRGCRLAAAVRLAPRDEYASSLWTLQRLYFEPDVAAKLLDRGENRDPGPATLDLSGPLTRNTRLENGARGSAAEKVAS
jgi:hypothetical protein